MPKTKPQPPTKEKDIISDTEMLDLIPINYELWIATKSGYEYSCERVLGFFKMKEIYYDDKNKIKGETNYFQFAICKDSSILPFDDNYEMDGWELFYHKPKPMEVVKAFEKQGGWSDGCRNPERFFTFRFTKTGNLIEEGEYKGNYLYGINKKKEKKDENQKD